MAYPDMELVPSIANYFGVSIDELFGYRGDREQKVEALLEKIREMDRDNNGQDVCIEACIGLARDGLVEFPGHEKLLLCLANLLYNAGYARYGEHHLTDDEGYDVYDAERHRTYAEWQEARAIYERLVKQLEDGSEKQEAILRLTQLYGVCGETDKAMELIGTLPDVSGCRDILMLYACDGKRCAQEYDRTLSKLVCVCANLLCKTVMVRSGSMSNDEAIRRVKKAIDLLEMKGASEAALSDELTYHEAAGMYLYLSVFLWRAGDQAGAFAALDMAYDAARRHDRDALEEHNRNTTERLPEYWPCWCVPDHHDVEAEIKADSRWAAWEKRCRGCE